MRTLNRGVRTRIRTRFPSRSTTFVLVSMPMVLRKLGVNTPSTKRRRRQDLPTSAKKGTHQDHGGQTPVRAARQHVRTRTRVSNEEQFQLHVHGFGPGAGDAHFGEGAAPKHSGRSAVTAPAMESRSRNRASVSSRASDITADLQTWGKLQAQSGKAARALAGTLFTAGKPSAKLPGPFVHRALEVDQFLRSVVGDDIGDECTDAGRRQSLRTPPSPVQLEWTAPTSELGPFFSIDSQHSVAAEFQASAKKYLADHPPLPHPRLPRKSAPTALRVTDAASRPLVSTDSDAGPPPRASESAHNHLQDGVRVPRPSSRASASARSSAHHIVLASIDSTLQSTDKALASLGSISTAGGEQENEGARGNRRSTAGSLTGLNLNLKSIATLTRSDDASVAVGFRGVSNLKCR